jgi:inhibitor of cysteine peptidase
MKKSFIINVLEISSLFCVLLLLIVSCNWSKAQQVSEVQNGEIVTLKVGETLQVLLEGNITTGFTWEIAKNDANIIEPQGEREYQQENTNLVGSGGTFIFKFKAIEKGQTNLWLVYHRSFEKDNPPAKEFKLQIKVE